MNLADWTESAHRFAKGRIVRVTAIVAVAVAGAWIGIMLGGAIRTNVGPVELGMRAEPSWAGETVVDAHPFGTLLFDTHNAPVNLRITLENINPDRAKAILLDARFSDRLPALLEKELGDGVRTLVLRAALCGLAGGLIATLIVFRRPGAALAGLLSVAVLIAGTGVAIALTFRPDSVVEPKYTGLLAGAPSLVGNAESIVTKFESYRVQLAKLVNNVSQLYDTVSVLPVYDADPTSIRVLHVSDIHLSPIAWNSSARSPPVQDRCDRGHRRPDRPRHQSRGQVRRGDRHPRRAVRLRQGQPRLQGHPAGRGQAEGRGRPGRLGQDRGGAAHLRAGRSPVHP